MQLIYLKIIWDWLLCQNKQVIEIDANSQVFVKLWIQLRIFTFALVTESWHFASTIVKIICWLLLYQKYLQVVFTKMLLFYGLFTILRQVNRGVSFILRLIFEVLMVDYQNGTKSHKVEECPKKDFELKSPEFWSYKFVIIPLH